jgi:hypothetical protein
MSEIPEKPELVLHADNSSPHRKSPHKHIKNDLKTIAKKAEI